MPPDACNAIDLARVLSLTTLGNMHYLPETDSTNEVALRRADGVPPESSELVLAGRQLRGKGRGANRWWSGEGSLTFSLITPRLSLPPNRVPMLSLTAGLAIGEAVESAAPDACVRLKWPNDVYLDGRKAAGILIESASPRFDRFVVGVGLNVNNQLEHAPVEVRERATSLSAATGQRHDLTRVLAECLNRFDACAALLTSGDVTLQERLSAASLLDGRRVRLALPTETIEGECRGINDDGALRIDTRTGERVCYAGVVEWHEP